MTNRSSLLAAFFAGCLNTVAQSEMPNFQSGVLEFYRSSPHTAEGRRMERCFSNLPNVDEKLKHFDGVCDTFHTMKTQWDDGCDSLFLAVKKNADNKFEGVVCLALEMCQDKFQELDPMQAECLQQCENTVVEVPLTTSTEKTTLPLPGNSDEGGTETTSDSGGTETTSDSGETTGAQTTTTPFGSGNTGEKNQPEYVQKTVPSCKKAFFFEAGLNHPKICGNSLPLEYMYGMLNLPFDIFLNLLVACITMPSQFISVAFGGVDSFTPFAVSLNAIIQVLCLMVCIYRLNSAMWKEEVTHTCRFFVFSMLYMYGPVATAFNSLVSTLGVKGAMALMRGAKDEKYYDRKWLPYHIIVVPMNVLSIFGILVGIIFLICGLLPLLIMAFWGIVAYPHIFLILLLPIYIVICAIIPFDYCMGEKLEQKVNYYAAQRMQKKNNEEDPNEDPNEDAKNYVDQQKDATGLFFGLVMGVSIVVFVLQISVGFFGAIAMLYWHGDYLKFHGAFFNQFSAPSITFPSLGMIFIFDWDAIKWLWQKFLSFELALPVKFVYGISVMTQVVCAIMVFATGLVRGFKLCKRRSSSQPDRDTHRDTV